MSDQPAPTHSIVPPDWAYPLFAEYGLSRAVADFLFDGVPTVALILGIRADEVRRTIVDTLPMLKRLDARLKAGVEPDQRQDT